jgi:hypothetical protein
MSRGFINRADAMRPVASNILRFDTALQGKGNEGFAPSLSIITVTTARPQRYTLLTACGLALVALLLTLPAAHPLTSYRLDVGGSLDAPFISGVGLPGNVDGVTYRWTSGATTLRLPVIDTNAPLQLALRTGDNWRPSSAGPLTLTVKANGVAAATIALHSGWDWYSATLTPAMLRDGVNLTLTSVTFTEVNGVNQLGVPLDAVTLQSLDTSAPLDLWLPLALAASVLLATLLAGRRGWQVGLAVGLLTVAALTPALYLARPLFALYIGIILVGLATALALRIPSLNLSRWERSKDRSPIGRGRERVGGYLFVAALAVYLLLTPGQFSSDDDQVKYLATESLLLRHSFTLPTPVYGASYSKYGVGPDLEQMPLLAPVLLLERATGTPQPSPLRQLSVTLANPLLGAFIVWLLYVTALLLYRRRNVALGVALIGGGATTIFAYALLTSTELLLAALLLALCYCLLRYFAADTGVIYHAPTASAHVGAQLIAPASRLWLARAGLLLAGLTLAKQEYVLVGLLVIGWWLLRMRYERKATAGALTGGVIWLVAPLLLAIASNAAYNLLASGDPLNPGYTPSAFVPATISSELTGIYGMLASPGKSLLLYSPPLLLLPFTMRRFGRNLRWDIMLWAAISGLLLLFYARLPFWSGDLAWGPRYIMPLTPILILPLGVLLGNFAAWSRRLKLAFAALITLGVAVQLLSALVSFQSAFFAALTGDIATHYTEWQFIPAQSPLVQMSALLFNGQITAPAISHLSSYGLPVLADYLLPAALLSPVVAAGRRLWQVWRTDTRWQPVNATEQPPAPLIKPASLPLPRVGGALPRFIQRFRP